MSDPITIGSELAENEADTPDADRELLPSGVSAFSTPLLVRANVTTTVTATITAAITTATELTIAHRRVFRGGRTPGFPC